MMQFHCEEGVSEVQSFNSFRFIIRLYFKYLSNFNPAFIYLHSPSYNAVYSEMSSSKLLND